MSKYRILVADQAEAIFYDAPTLHAAPKEVARISDPLARLHDRDFATERPGRSSREPWARCVTRSSARTPRAAPRPCASRAASPAGWTTPGGRTSSSS